MPRKGRKAGRWTLKDAEDMRKLKAEGKSQKQIADIYGISPAYERTIRSGRYFKTDHRARKKEIQANFRARKRQAREEAAELARHKLHETKGVVVAYCPLCPHKAEGLSDENTRSR